MKRSTRFKILNITFALIVIFLTIDLYKAYKTPLLFLFPILPILLSRIITKLAWKKFYEGRKLTQQKNYKLALEKYNSFLVDIEKSSILKHLMYLTFRVYTPSLLAVVYNNIASCHINLSQLKQAKQAIAQSLEQDELYPIPYYNLAIINIIEGKNKTAKKNLDKVNQFGFKTVRFEPFEAHIQKVYNISPSKKDDTEDTV